MGGNATAGNYLAKFGMPVELIDPGAKRPAACRALADYPKRGLQDPETPLRAPALRQVGAKVLDALLLLKYFPAATPLATGSAAEKYANQDGFAQGGRRHWPGHGPLQPPRELGVGSRTSSGRRSTAC